MMFEPRLSSETLAPAAISSSPTPRVAYSGGDLADRRSVAGFDEWGHAVEAPTDTAPAQRLGMPPFTP